MHVLQFLWDFPPEYIGGLGTHGYNLSEYLYKKMNLDVITPTQSSKINRDYITYLNIRREKLFFKGDTQSYINNLNMSAFQQAEQIITKSKSMMILHSHDFFFASALVSLKKKYNLPIITTIHLPQSIINVQMFRELERLAINSSDIIICVSNFVSEEIQKQYQINPHKIRIIHNGLPPKERNQKLDRNFFLLFVGRLVIEKGLLVLLESMRHILKHHPNLRLVIVGDGPLEYVLRKRIRQYGIHHRVKLLGFISRNELEDYYEKAFALICPSLYEPFGLTILEAMRSNLPVIASNVGGIKEIITHEKSGLLFEQGDTKDLAQKVLSIIEDDNKWECLADNGYQTFLNRFTLRTMGENVVECYKAIAR
jgi:1,4-alpha-glucan branching enzyme